MTRKRIIIVLLVILLAAFSVVIGYLVTRDSVRVTDAASGLPIAGAHVRLFYHSFSVPYLTDGRGIARISGFEPGSPYGVEVTAAGYLTNIIYFTYPTATNHSGWRGGRKDISLQPVPET
jgi:hypothetical protein